MAKLWKMADQTDPSGEGESNRLWMEVYQIGTQEVESQSPSQAGPPIDDGDNMGAMSTDNGESDNAWC